MSRERFLSFLSLLHLPFFDVTETNSDPPLRCLLLLLLLLLPGQFVSSSSSETSHLSHGPDGEENPRRDAPNLPGASVWRPGGVFGRGCRRRGEGVKLRERSESDGCRSASSRGGGLTLLPLSGTPRKVGFDSC